jgi:hypothetical protein
LELIEAESLGKEEAMIIDETFKEPVEIPDKRKRKRYEV